MAEIIQLDVGSHQVQRMASEAYAGPLHVDAVHGDGKVVMLALMDQGAVSGCVVLSLDAAQRLVRSLERSIAAAQNGTPCPSVPLQSGEQGR